MLLALCLTLPLLLHPSAALAQRAPSDEISERPLSTSRSAARLAPDIDAASGILITDDGRVLWSRRPDAQRPMASTTKMMTALLTLKAGALDDTVTVSKAATHIEDGAGLAAGERLTVRQLLRLALVHSANDAAYALGEHVGGTMPTFVQMMNDEAARLGLKHTHYVNPDGLDERGQYSSAADLAKLAHVVMGLQEFRDVVVMRTVRIPGRAGHRAPRVYGTTDELLGKYRGLLGVKTGYTKQAGYCFVGLATRGGVSLTAVVMGTRNNAARFAQATRLLDWGFGHVKAKTVVSVAETIGAVPLAGVTDGQVVAQAGATACVPVFDMGGPVGRRLVIGSEVGAPVFAGEPLGTVTYTQSGRALARVPLLACATASTGRAFGAVPVSDYLDRTVSAGVGDITAAAPLFDKGVAVRRRIVLDPEVAAPVAAGQRLGTIDYSQGGRLVVSVPLVATRHVSAPGALEAADIWLVRVWRGLVGGPKMAARQVEDV